MISLFIANAIAHIVSFRELSQEGAEERFGVLAFVFINAAIAIFIGLNLSWSIWPALIFPTIGGLALTSIMIRKGGGSMIDYVILGLDIVTISYILIVLRPF